ncbi:MULTISPECIES: AbrB/MazE/SpoVT family DNA-binding domain-containing protein [unclassified Endozoicomonas]|uniref:AbrB/MazE/SpoVT family DNA-binding domain-containing protein n=1 Tax=unclassified Endozoicomonas TaxID=2644528 RepID=UPI003BB699A4
MPKLTTKRQVTIPQAICEKLGLEPGDRIQVFERDGVAHLVKMTDQPLVGTLSNCHNAVPDMDRAHLKSAIRKKAAKKLRWQE